MDEEEEEFAYPEGPSASRRTKNPKNKKETTAEEEETPPKKKKPDDEEEDGEQEGRPDQSSDCAMARERSLLSEAGVSCRIGLRGQRGGERGRGWCRLLVGFRGQRASLRRLRGQKLSVSLSVNLSDDGDVQLTEAALQLAASSLGSGSHDKEEDDDRAPV